MILKQKTIVITGGTSGVGLEMVKRLSIENEVIVIGRNADKLLELTDKFQNIHIYQADLISIADVESVANKIRNDYIKIDVLINNAAVQHSATFLDADFEFSNITDEVSVNFTSICHLTYQLLPVLQHDNQAFILNINSGLALAPKASSAVYCATKAALNSFSQSMSYQLMSTNVRVLQAFLALVDTPMTQGRGDNKMTAVHAANLIIKGLVDEKRNHYIGKVKLLIILLRTLPWLVKKIMKSN